MLRRAKLAGMKIVPPRRVSWRRLVLREPHGGLT